MAAVEDILISATKQGASDIHLITGMLPMIRINTGLSPAEGFQSVTENEIEQFVRENVGGRDAFVAIDAPLIVPNLEGRRVAEALTGQLFRKYDAGAHPANRTRLGQWSDGKIRGEEITRLLEDEGFRHNPYIDRFEERSYKDLNLEGLESSMIKIAQREVEFYKKHKRFLTLLSGL